MENKHRNADTIIVDEAKIIAASFSKKDIEIFNAQTWKEFRTFLVDWFNNHAKQRLTPEEIKEVEHFFDDDNEYRYINNARITVSGQIDKLHGTNTYDITFDKSYNEY